MTSFVASWYRFSKRANCHKMWAHVALSQIVGWFWKDQILLLCSYCQIYQRDLISLNRVGFVIAKEKICIWFWMENLYWLFLKIYNLVYWLQLVCACTAATVELHQRYIFDTFNWLLLTQLKICIWLKVFVT